MTDDSGPATVATGVDHLDPVLGGGYPDGGATMVTGRPGTGKRALAAAFLGADPDARTLYVATRRTAARVRAALAARGLDVDAGGLAVASTQETVGGLFGGDRPSPAALFEQLFGQYEPLDRVVIDGVGTPGWSTQVTPVGSDAGDGSGQSTDSAAGGSGRSSPTASGASTGEPSPDSGGRSAGQGGDDSAPVGGDGRSGERGDAAEGRLLRRIVATTTRALGASTMLLADAGDPAAAERPLGQLADLAGDADAALHCARRDVDGDSHRTLRLRTSDQPDADHRVLELRAGPDGPLVAPHRRTPPPGLVGGASAPTGIEGLDRLCGGGLAGGGGVLVQHDGRVPLGPVLGAVLASALDRGATLELVPTVHLRERRLRAMLSAAGYDLDELLATDRAFVFDVVGAWRSGLENVFGSREELPEVRSMLAGIADRTDGARCRVVNADALVHTLGTADARTLRHVQAVELDDPDDLLVHVQQPAACPDAAVASYEDAAEQILTLSTADGGRYYASLEKSPTGAVGASALLEFAEEPPFVTVHHGRGRSDASAR